MDFYVDIAFTVLLRVLKDKKQSMLLRKAFLKVFRLMMIQFAFDKEFQAVLQAYCVPLKVE